MPQKQKIIITIIIFIIVALLIVISALVWRGFFGAPKEVETITGQEEKEDDRTAEERTRDLIDEVQKIVKDMDGKNEKPISQVISIENGEEGGAQAVIVAPGTNPISVETGEVINVYGQELDNSAMSGSSGAPSQSQPVNPNQLPSNTIKISITPNSMTPSEFKVKSGQVVFLSATAGETSVEAFVFLDSELGAVSIGLLPGETRAITFKAPEKKGEYIYFSSVLNHRQKGAEGKMIVE